MLPSEIYTRHDPESDYFNKDRLFLSRRAIRLSLTNGGTLRGGERIFRLSSANPHEPGLLWVDVTNEFVFPPEGDA